ncbi:MAG: hypothetical protein WC773_00905 [Patescibacteria group bacterium]|jgi:hypothetical protein
MASPINILTQPEALKSTITEADSDNERLFVDDEIKKPIDVAETDQKAIIHTFDISGWQGKLIVGLSENIIPYMIFIDLDSANFVEIRFINLWCQTVSELLQNNITLLPSTSMTIDDRDPQNLTNYVLNYLTAKFDKSKSTKIDSLSKSDEVIAST